MIVDSQFIRTVKIGGIFLAFSCIQVVAQSRVGVNTVNPQATLDVSGEIKLGDAANSPLAGMVRWNASAADFEGYNGTTWISLTKSNAPKGQWGQIASSNVNESIKLTAADGTSGDRFGYAVSISGDYAIVGAYWDDVGANIDQGSAYIFTRNGSTWTQQAKLVASDGQQSNLFGAAVGISGDYAIVGAWSNNVGLNSRQGSAYIFQRTGTSWIQQAKLVSSDGATDDYFGVSVGIDSDYAIIGASQHNIGATTDQGAAYVFVRTGTVWSQQVKLVASDGAANDQFGKAVSISGGTAVVGVSSNDVGSAVNQGSVYVYVRNGNVWSEQSQLLASDGLANDLFGVSVSISGDYLVVGAFGDDFGAFADRGSAYIFFRSGSSWSQQAKLFASDGTANHFFGYAVSLSGSQAVVGGFNIANGDIISQGAAYIFVRNGTSWIQQAKVTASDGAANDNFGYAVSVSGDFAIIAAYLDDSNAVVDQGSVYILQKNN